MFRVTFLADKDPQEVRQALETFSHRYCLDWKRWQRVYRADQTSANGSIATFGEILRKWQATRPRQMRRPQGEASHPTPFLDDLVTEAHPAIQILGGIDLRTLACHEPAQMHDIKEALSSLWNTFLKLTCDGHATCVGISKAVLLLTEGRLGPAFDSTARQNLDVDSPGNSVEWVRLLRSVSEDLRRFEEKNHLQIDSLVAKQWAPLNVGRVYDMIVGPRQSA